ncbi:MAG: methyltransferase domain-containing protein [Bacteroidetes bacterium]|nr:methyltransferase domain-containing protein [Bacteroidota bacterium]
MKQFMRFLMRRIPRPILLRLSYIFRFFIVRFYKGNQLECPVCETQFRKMLPYGINSRENAMCPKCLSLERHRLIWLYLQNKTNIFTGKNKMLHIAPEQCFLGRFKKLEKLDYTTGDLFSPLADVKMDVHDIPFDDNTFDIVFCNHVLEHVTDDHKAMSEICRVLKPGGWAMLQSPKDPKLKVTKEDPSITDPWEREREFGQKDHVRMYGDDYAARMAKAGFKVIEDQTVFELGEKYKYYSLLPGEILYVGVKPN